MASASSVQVIAKPPAVAALAAPKRVQRAAEADARQRDGEHEPEHVRRAAEQRREHAVPDQLHQQEGEADRGGGEVDQRCGAESSSRRSLLLVAWSCVRDAASDIRRATTATIAIHDRRR